MSKGKVVRCPREFVGGRDADFANHFMLDLAARLDSCVQLTSDGHKPYLKAVEGAFGDDIDYAMLVKLYGNLTGGKGHERKYSPAECNGTKKKARIGNPRYEEGIDLIRGTSKPDHAHVYASIHSTDKRIQQEV